MVDWKDKNTNLPDSERRVLIWWLRADEDRDFQPVPGVAFGRYIEVLKQWRPTGCNGNFNDQVTHWAELPNGPYKQRKLTTIIN